MQTPKKIINGKTVFYFIIVDVIIFLFFVVEDYYIGSPGSARLEPNSPKSSEFIINNIHIYPIVSTLMTFIAFWLNYLHKKSKN